MTSRRHFLSTTACGFGSLALAAMAHGAGGDSLAEVLDPRSPLCPRRPHHAPKAKRIIFLFMAGGVSHVDSFDHKPLLTERNGDMMTFDDARSVAKTGMGSTQRVFKPLWDFHQYGQSGKWCSDLFPNINKHVDDLCFIHSMHTEGVAHGPATLFMHTGSTSFIRPSMGSWVSYGLGTENENLPAFVTLSPSLGNGGPRNYGTAFLPPIFQGTALGRAGQPATEATIKNLGNPLLRPDAQRRQFDLLRGLNNEELHTANPVGHDQELEAVIASYELAWRLQANAPDALDIEKESASTLEMYGVGNKTTDNFGRQCLMARRLAERGVRYIQVNYSDNTANPAWDQHSNLRKHGDHAAAVDQPVAALLTDLKERGLLEDTIVWFGSEFGRTPYAEKNGTGRDHNPLGFTVWLAGGGVKSGFAYGATDDFGHFAVQDKVHMHDLHATILWLLGLDHLRLTFRYAGRDFRLTDVHGNVVRDVIA